MKIYRKALKYSWIILLIALCQTDGLGQPPFVDAVTPLNGLEKDNPRQLHLFIVELSEDAHDIGLTNEELQIKCELRLRQSGVEPVDSLKVPFLFVYCNLLKGAYNIELRFYRDTYYSVAKTIFRSNGITWIDGATGTHAGNKQNILNSLDGRLDIFLNEYLKANPSLPMNK